MKKKISLENKLIYVIAIIYSIISDDTFPRRYNCVECEAKGHELVELKYKMKK